MLGALLCLGEPGCSQQVLGWSWIMGMRPLALACGLQPEAASEPLRRWDEHRGCRGVGSSPGSLWDSPWLALLLLLCLCLALVQASFLESCVSEEFSLRDGLTNLSTRLVHALENRMEESISSEALTTA